MINAVRVTIHTSQFPESVEGQLHDSLRSRLINHKFHYDSIKQTQKWLELHQALSPSRNDPDCIAAYERAFEAVCRKIRSSRVHLIGVGCGGGKKDSRLLALLKESGRDVAYTACDVSLAMVLTAWKEALNVVQENDCFPFVCDLSNTRDLAKTLLPAPRSDTSVLITFFGMIPNFEPDFVMTQLTSLVNAGDMLLLSANLAPGPDYMNGVNRIVPLYDNKMTRDWLMMFLLDLGVEPGDGVLKFFVESDPGSGLLRVAAYFRFDHARTIRVGHSSYSFASQDKIRLFYSYRHTPALIDRLCADRGLQLKDRWVAGSGEEGVFLCESAG